VTLASSEVKFDEADEHASEPTLSITIFFMDVNPFRSWVAIFSISCICLCENVTAFWSGMWIKEFFEQEQFLSCDLRIPLESV